MMSVWSCLIFTFALLKNMKLCPGQHYILGHSAVISDTVYLKQLLMAKELIGTSLMNVEHSNQCKPPYQKTWWLVHSPRTLCTRKSRNHSKNQAERSEKFKLCIHNFVVSWNIAFYVCLTLRIKVKCTGAIFVCNWVESIG